MNLRVCKIIFQICSHLGALPVVDVALSVRGWWADCPEKADERKVPFAFGKSLSLVFFTLENWCKGVLL